MAKDELLAQIYKEALTQNTWTRDTILHGYCRLNSKGRFFLYHNRDRMRISIFTIMVKVGLMNQLSTNRMGEWYEFTQEGYDLVSMMLL